jgi:transcriptional regulator with XRE-family HTH domain
MDERGVKRAKTAREFSEMFRSDPERERLYRESQIRFGLSDRMAEMRKHQKLSQEQLAERVGCRQPFIAKLEGGAYDKCEISTLRTFARAMGYDISTDAMFYPISGAFYTKKSSAAFLERALLLQDALCEKITSIAASRWSEGEPSALPKSAALTIRKESKTAA